MSNEEEAITENNSDEVVDPSAQQTNADDVSHSETTDQPSETQADTEPTIESLQEQVEALKQELADTKDQALRTVAEAQNTKRRAEKDIQSARKFALEKFAGDLLGVADNLERALELTDKDNETLKPLVEGVELTQKSLIDTLSKHKVEQLDPVGEPFDPQFHQAMSMVENPDVEPNTITMVMQKGYSLHGRLLRPAMVAVAKAPATSIDEKA